MTETWKDDNCTAMKVYYAVYSVPEAAALWCGVDKNQVKKALSKVTKLSETGFGRGVWLHDDIPCLEPRSRAIADAILDGTLPHGREDGVTVGPNDGVAAERCHVMGRDLKIWMEAEFPNEKPEFLFDNIERNSRSEITLEVYQALIADRDALKLRVDKAIISFTELRDCGRIMKAPILPIPRPVKLVNQCCKFQFSRRHNLTSCFFHKKTTTITVLT
jgi:hypothetical protein